jgi:hypothetical protein
MRQCAIRITPKGVEEQLFGSRFILLNGTAPSKGEGRNQSLPEANPRIDGLRVKRQRLLEGALRFLEICYRKRPAVLGPATHDEIARTGIYRPFLLDPSAYVAQEFDIERLGETSGDVSLRLG